MRIRWTGPAASDLTRICGYLEEHDSPVVARRIALSIYEGVEALIQFPRRGRPGRSLGTRELVFPRLPYVAVYRAR
jgi:plasmid stabilization system protein ParE